MQIDTIDIPSKGRVQGASNEAIAQSKEEFWIGLICVVLEAKSCQFHSRELLHENRAKKGGFGVYVRSNGPSLHNIYEILFCV